MLVVGDLRKRLFEQRGALPARTSEGQRDESSVVISARADRVVEGGSAPRAAPRAPPGRRPAASATPSSRLTASRSGLRRRLAQRPAQVADRGYRSAAAERLGRGGAQLSDRPLVAAGLGEQQVGGDGVDRGAVVGEQARGAGVLGGAARASAAR